MKKTVFLRYGIIAAFLLAVILPGSPAVFAQDGASADTGPVWHYLAAAFGLGMVAIAAAIGIGKASAAAARWSLPVCRMPIASAARRS